MLPEPGPTVLKLQKDQPTHRYVVINPHIPADRQLLHSYITDSMHVA